MTAMTQIHKEVHATGGDGAFYLCRAEDALPELISKYGGQVQLIYLDPPFSTGETFQMKMSGRSKPVTFTAYTDTLSREDYLSMMRTVLTGCKELLSDTGSIYLHIDHRMSAHIRLMLDELYGESNFMNEIIWVYKSGGRSKRYFSRKHDTILFYRKSPRVYFDIASIGTPRGPEKRNHMKRSIDETGRICFSIRSGGKTYTYYEDSPVYPTDVWADIEHLHQRDPERVGYATQKPVALLNRIIGASSRPGDIVCDLFSGSGTTAAAASAMQRRYLCCDCSPFAMFALRQRQLSAHAATSMLAAHMPMTLYHANAAQPSDHGAVCHAIYQNGAVQVTSHRTAGVNALVYAAAGIEKNGVFTVQSHQYQPQLPLTLPCGGGTPLLHTIDEAGRQFFFNVAVSV